MKIFLTVNEPNIDGGFFWGCPNNSSIKNPQEFYKCGEYCMEGQCTELYAPNILDIFQINEIESYIPYWAKLIPKGGKITLGGTDFYIAARNGLRRAKSLGDVNKILFSKPYAIQSLTSSESTVNFLKSLNFYITNISIDDNTFNYVVEGVKK